MHNDKIALQEVENIKSERDKGRNELKSLEEKMKGQLTDLENKIIQERLLCSEKDYHKVRFENQSKEAKQKLEQVIE